MLTITCRQINGEVNKEVQQDEKEVDQMYYRDKILNTKKCLKPHHAVNCSSCSDITNASRNNFILWFYPKNCSHAFFLSPEGEYKKNRRLFLNYSRSCVFINFRLVGLAWMWTSSLFSFEASATNFFSTSNLGETPFRHGGNRGANGGAEFGFQNVLYR